MLIPPWKWQFIVPIHGHVYKRWWWSIDFIGFGENPPNVSRKTPLQMPADGKDLNPRMTRLEGKERIMSQTWPNTVHSPQYPPAPLCLRWSWLFSLACWLFSWWNWKQSNLLRCLLHLADYLVILRTLNYEIISAFYKTTET